MTGSTLKLFSFLDWSHSAFSTDQRWPNTLQVSAWLGRERGRGREERRGGQWSTNYQSLLTTFSHIPPTPTHPFLHLPFLSLSLPLSFLISSFPLLFLTMFLLLSLFLPSFSPFPSIFSLHPFFFPSPSSPFHPYPSFSREKDTGDHDQDKRLDRSWHILTAVGRVSGSKMLEHTRYVASQCGCDVTQCKQNCGCRGYKRYFLELHGEDEGGGRKGGRGERMCLA